MIVGTTKAKPIWASPILICAVLISLSLVTLVGCTSPSPGEKSPAAAIRVSGPVGRLPVVAFRTPLKPKKSVVKLVIHGSGGPVVNGEPVVLNLSMFNGRTGLLAASTYQEGQHPLATTPTSDSLFPIVQQALQGARAGDRIMVEATADDAFGAVGAPQYDIKGGDAVVMIVDVMGTPPAASLSRVEGQSAPTTGILPRLEYREGLPEKLVFNRRPLRLRQPRVVVLIAGEGPTVGVGNVLKLHYLEQSPNTVKPQINTWFGPPETFIFDNEGGLQTWQRALLGVKQGSRVMILVPVVEPRTSGRAKLGKAYVVDVLGVG